MTDCKKFISEISGFKLFHMNVCSIRAKHNELVALFHSLQGDLDCIILSEAHINTELMNINQYSFEGYKAYCTENNIWKTDGIVIYVKSSLEHSIEEVILRDANCLQVKITKNKKNILLLYLLL